jgi:sulfite reductase beta subunit-like hemoprotein
MKQKARVGKENEHDSLRWIKEDKNKAYGYSFPSCQIAPSEEIPTLKEL